MKCHVGAHNSEHSLDSDFDNMLLNRRTITIKSIEYHKSKYNGQNVKTSKILQGNHQNKSRCRYFDDENNKLTGIYPKFSTRN